MDVVEAVRTLASRGVEILEAIASGLLKRVELNVTHGASVAGRWTRMAETYTGPTRSETLQAAAVAAAREGGLPLAALERIEKHVRGLFEGAAISRWQLRVELCGLRGTVDEIDRAAATRVRDYNRSVRDAAQKAYSRRALRGGKNTDTFGMRTISFTRPERDMATILAQVDALARPLREQDPALSLEQARADALLTLTLSRLPAGTPPPPVPLVVVPAPEWAKLHRREGSESIFGLTDGTTITGAELVAGEMSEHHYVGLYDPVEGPVDLYRSRRTASVKQRMLLAAESLFCETPECTTSAEDSEVHHIEAWKKGGQTNLANMTMACRRHNALNDDDPDAPPRNGRLDRLPGGIVFHPPDGGPPRTNRHPVRAYSARGLLADP